MHAARAVEHEENAGATPEGKTNTRLSKPLPSFLGLIGSQEPGQRGDAMHDVVPVDQADIALGSGGGHGWSAGLSRSRGLWQNGELMDEGKAGSLEAIEIETGRGAGAVLIPSIPASGVTSAGKFTLHQHRHPAARDIED